MTEEINYKQRYFSILRYLKQLERRMRINRCPPSIYRKCCGGCNLIKSKYSLIEKELLEKGEYNE